MSSSGYAAALNAKYAASMGTDNTHSRLNWLSDSKYTTTVVDVAFNEQPSDTAPVQRATFCD